MAEHPSFGGKLSKSVQIDLRRKFLERKVEITKDIIEGLKRKRAEMVCRCDMTPAQKTAANKKTQERRKRNKNVDPTEARIVEYRKRSDEIKGKTDEQFIEIIKQEEVDRKKQKIMRRQERKKKERERERSEERKTSDRRSGTYPETRRHRT